jgi:hypothetical protein
MLIIKPLKTEERIYMNKEKIPKIIQPFMFGKINILTELIVWLKAVFSLTGFWAFIPVLIGVGVVYYGESQGSDTRTWKGPCEMIAIWLMGATTALFLLRAILFRTYTDMILLALAASFLCREIHFTGTHKGIYYAIGIIGAWTWLWRDRLLEEVDGKKQLKVAVFCMCWSYLVAIIIQKRVFKEKRLPLLPNEDLLHVPLEEVTENFSHAAFFLVGLVSFFFTKKVKEEEVP